MALMKGHSSQELTRNPDVKLTGALLKKGTVSYEPMPFLTPEPQPQAPTIRVLSEHRAAPETVPAPAPNIQKVREEAQTLIEKTKADSERLLSEAQLKSKKLIEQSKLYAETAYHTAQREGFAKGQEEGKKAGLQEAGAVMRAAQQTLAQTVAEHERLTKAAEENLAKLAVKIAERVIGSEVALNPNVVVSMVKANLERVKEREQVIVRVNPEDFEMVKSKRDVFERFVPKIRSLDIESDVRVGRGSCMIETNLGVVDASITTQLEAIEQAFAAAEKPAEAALEPELVSEPPLEPEPRMTEPEPNDEASDV